MIRRVLPLILAVVIIGFAGPLNNSIIDSRMHNLDILLEQASTDSSGVPASLAILVRFELVRRRLEVGESELANYELEARLLSLISGPQFSAGDDPGPAEEPGFLSRSFLAVSKRLVGVPDDTLPSRPWLPDLERAFLFERARRYRQAVSAYDSLLRDYELNERTVATIRLHQAFCHAMANELETAGEITSELIRANQDPEIVTVARRILEFLDFVNGRRHYLGAARLSGLERGRSLYFAMDYEAGHVVLSDFVGRQTGDDNEAEARYYLGRTSEEMGNPTEAMKEYVRVGMLDSSGVWAKEAMRRILILASLYFSDDELAEQSRRQLVRLNDTAFTDTLDSYRGLMSELPEPEALPRSADEPGSPEPAELFVRTEPRGATVFVDGIEHGTSPLFVENIPPGRVFVEAFTGNFAGQATVDAREGEIATVVLTLGMQFGALDVITPLTNVVVYLDETSALSLDSPALSQVVPGEYLVLIEGRNATGQMYFTEREVVIHPNTTTRLEISLP